MQYKTAFFLGLAVFCFTSLATARVVGSGKVASETRAIAGEHGVNLAGLGDLTITQGDREELVVEAEDNLLPLIESTVDKDGVLVIRFKEYDIRPTKNVTYKLTVRRLDLVELSGSGSIASERLDADHLQVRLPGSGNIAIAHLEAGDLGVKLAGSGKVQLAAGTARQQTIQLSGSGNYTADGVQSDTVAVSISGSGDARVHANGTLDVKIGGSGEVSYAGNPKLTQRISGSGEVHRM